MNRFIVIDGMRIAIEHIACYCDRKGEKGGSHIWLVGVSEEWHVATTASEIDWLIVKEEGK